MVRSVALAILASVRALFTSASLAFLVVAIACADTPGVDLDEDLYTRALAHAATLEQPNLNDGLVARLGNREVEALYEVAKSMNDAGDAISSVLIWHALADDGSEGEDPEAYDETPEFDYEGHVPSALALGFAYYEVDKPRALQYFLRPPARRCVHIRRPCTMRGDSSWSSTIRPERWRTYDIARGWTSNTRTTRGRS